MLTKRCDKACIWKGRFLLLASQPLPCSAMSLSPIAEPNRVTSPGFRASHACPDNSLIVYQDHNSQLGCIGVYEECSMGELGVL